MTIMKTKLISILSGMALCLLLATYLVSCQKDIVLQSVSISNCKRTLEKGKSATLTYTIDPTNATKGGATWSSTNPSVATVNASTGVVTGVSVGEAKIVLTSNSDSKITNECVVNVVILATEVLINEKAKTVLATSTEAIKFTAKITPEDATATLAWESSDTDVAEIDAKTGVVKLKAVGETEITASVGSVSSTAVVLTLTGPLVVATGVTLKDGNNNLTDAGFIVPNGADNAKILTVAVAPDDATDKTVILKNTKTDDVAVEVGPAKKTAVTGKIYATDGTTEVATYSATYDATGKVVSISITGTKVGDGTLSFKAKSAAASVVATTLKVRIVIPATGIGLKSDNKDIVAPLTVNYNPLAGGTQIPGVVVATLTPMNLTIKTVTLVNTKKPTVESVESVLDATGDIYDAKGNVKVASYKVTALDATTASVTFEVTGVAVGVGVLNVKSGAVEKTLNFNVVIPATGLVIKQADGTTDLTPATLTVKSDGTKTATFIAYVTNIATATDKTLTVQSKADEVKDVGQASTPAVGNIYKTGSTTAVIATYSATFVNNTASFVVRGSTGSAVGDGGSIIIKGKSGGAPVTVSVTIN